MDDKSEQAVQISFDVEELAMLKTCAAWRNVSTEELIKADVLDWLDIDFPESKGRLTRRGIYRDGLISLEAAVHDTTSQNWREDLNISRIDQPGGRSA